MSLDNVTVPLALAAGAASFLSPCVLPLVPVYVSYLVRVPTGSAPPTKPSVVYGLSNSIAFVLGVSVVVVALFYALRTLLLPVRAFVAPVAGVLVIVFALHLLGWLRVPGIDREFRLFKTAPKQAGPVGGILLGAAFAAGWTPCIGPVLGAVLTSAATAGMTTRGLLLVAVYCVGLGLPFVVLGLALGKVTALVRALSAWRRPIDIASAVVLAVMGLLLLTNNLILITQIASRVIPTVDPFGL